MRHTDEKHCLGIAFPGGILYGLAGMLFEQVVDVLDHSGVSFANRPYSLAEPADGRTQSDAILPHLTLRAQVFQCLPKTIIVHLLHPNIVQLQKIDVIGCEPP
jgi:hypothetical protein